MFSKNYKLTKCQLKALEILNGEENVFLTGAAGTGKSFLIHKFLESKDRDDFPIVASTGAAAIIVGGRTFHSFFGLGIMEGGYEETILRALRNRKLKTRLNKIEGVIIDEISMLSAETIRAAEEVSRAIRNSSEPWGGIRVIAVGDFAQLPPVTHFGEKRDWAFLDPIWEVSSFVPVMLKTTVRTLDSEFIEILNYIRNGIVNERVKQFLDSKLVTSVKDDDITKLYAHRNTVEHTNLEQLIKLPGKVRAFETRYEAKSEIYLKAIKKNAPIPERIQVKKGAFVMLRRNDFDGKYVNGSLGYIHEIGEDYLKIMLDNGSIIKIKETDFTLLDADGKPVAQAFNFPITLAYAATIHKAQGMTLDRAVIDLRKLWEPGQAYVALSRLSSSEGLSLIGWNPQSIKTSQVVNDFYNSFEAL